MDARLAAPPDMSTMAMPPVTVVLSQSPLPLHHQSNTFSNPYLTNNLQFCTNSKESLKLEKGEGMGLCLRVSQHFQFFDCFNGIPFLAISEGAGTSNAAS